MEVEYIISPSSTKKKSEHTETLMVFVTRLLEIEALITLVASPTIGIATRMGIIA
jgi:hypothetical protein